MNFEQFKKQNIEDNQKLKEAYVKNPNFKHSPILPKPDIIFEKNYHFMNESLLEKQLRKEKKLQKKTEDAEKKQSDLPAQKANPNGDTIKKSDNEQIEKKNNEDVKLNSSIPCASLEIKEQQNSDDKDNSRTINISNHAKKEKEA